MSKKYMKKSEKKVLKYLEMSFFFRILEYNN